MTLPDTMHAIVARTTGTADVLEYAELPTPRPAAGEVLIRVAAAGVNYADVLQRQGRYPVPTNGSPVPGLEVAGEIVTLGAGVVDCKVGDHVCTLVDGGAYAEYAVAPALQLLRWPQGVDAVQAASLPEAGMTVWANVFQQGRLRAGETLLVHGGRGGVGSTAIQLGRALGAHVLATSGSAQGCADCVALGAAHAFNYRTDDVTAAALAATAGKGVDVILDPIGAANLAGNLAALAMDGRLVIIGFTGGAVADKVDLTRVLTRRLVVTGSAMRPRTPAEKHAVAQELMARAWPLYASGRCKPVIARVFPLREAANAHRCMEAGGYLGKIVLRVGA